MDKTKLKVLRTHGYNIPKQCGLCAHARIPRGEEFGTCAFIPYTHEKHSGPPRQLSIYRGGSCDSDFKPSEEALKALGDWKEFFDRRKHTRSDRYKTKMHI